MNTIFTSTGKKFWETNPTETWDAINGSEYDETTATTTMQNKKTAIVFIFFAQNISFLFARVGLRGHYHCTVLASRLMVENRQVNFNNTINIKKSKTNPFL